VAAAEGKLGLAVNNGSIPNLRLRTFTSKATKIFSDRRKAHN
jgi:hypothetical protein